MRFPDSAVALLVALATVLPGCGGGSDATKHYNTGVKLGDQGLWAEAIVEYDEAIRLNPKDATAYAHRALAYNALGRAADAQRDAGRAIELGFDAASLKGDIEQVKRRR